MLTRATLLSLLVSVPAAAESVAVLVVSATDLTEGQQQQLIDASESALRTLSHLQVKEQGRRAVLTGPKKRCGTDVDCLVALAQALKTDHALMLSLALVSNELKPSAFWVDVASRKAVWRQGRSGGAAQPEEVARALVENVLPGFVRKGWGAVEIEAEAGAIIKADGRKVATTPLEMPLALSEGPHEVDVVYANGSGILHRVTVVEGKRQQLKASFAAMPSRSTGPSQSETLQTVSYGLWTAGALSVAGSLVAGAFANRALSEVRACAGDDRSCTNFLDAQQRLQQSRQLANTANLLLIAGGVLGGAGAGLFTFDALRAGK